MDLKNKRGGGGGTRKKKENKLTKKIDRRQKTKKKKEKRDKREKNVNERCASALGCGVHCAGAIAGFGLCLSHDLAELGY